MTQVVELSIFDRVNLEVAEHFQLYKDHIKPHSLILDCGTGTGIAAKYIQDHIPSVTVMGLDVDAHREYPDSVSRALYDGHNMPFGKIFDTSLLFYTLHHAQDPADLLAQVDAITKDKMIVIEESDVRGTDHRVEMQLEARVYNALGLSPDFHHNGMSNEEFEAILSKGQYHVLSKQKLFSRTVKNVEKFLYVISANR